MSRPGDRPRRPQDNERGGDERRWSKECEDLEPPRGQPRPKPDVHQIGDESALLDIIRGVIAANADTVAQYRAGKVQTFGFLVGQVMKGSKGKANPKLASDLLKKELSS